MLIRMRRVLAFLAILAAPVALAKTRAIRSVQHDWHPPQCEQVGLQYLRYVDAAGNVHGSTLDPQSGTAEKPRAVRALAFGSPANVLWAVSTDGAIHRSTDAGCTWSVEAQVPEVLAGEEFLAIAARHADRVYVYTIGYHAVAPGSVVRLTGGTVETFTLPDPKGIRTLEVHPSDSLHLRAIGKSGLVLESRNGAATWTQVGVVSPLFIGEVRSAAFHPRDFDHILVGTKTNTGRISRDGGRTWTTMPLVTSMEIVGVAFSPADPRVQWVQSGPTLLVTRDDGQQYFQVDGDPSRDVFLAAHPRERETWVAMGTRSVGVRVTSPAGVTEYGRENVVLAMWSPAGTLYYVRLASEWGQ